jgi:hypothetical protein
VATKAITYALGRDCILRVEGRELHGVADVVVRESCTTVDATNYGGLFASSASAVVHRSYDLGFTVPDIATARWLLERRSYEVNGFQLPRILVVEFEGGLLETGVRGKYFTIHEVDADEPIDGAVIPRFQLRQWDAGIADSDDIAAGVA